MYRLECIDKYVQTTSNRLVFIGTCLDKYVHKYF